MFRFNTLAVRCSLFQPPIARPILHSPFSSLHSQHGVFPIWPPLDVLQIENFAKQNIAAVAVGAGAGAGASYGRQSGRQADKCIIFHQEERGRGARGWAGDKQKPFGLASASGQSLAFGYAS